MKECLLHFGSYELLEQIPSHEGEAFRSKSHDGHALKLKRYPTEFSSSPQWVEAFIGASRKAKLFNYPGIVRTYDVGQTRGQYYLAQEYVDGVSLRWILEELGTTAEIPIGIMVHIIIKLCDSLIHIHDYRQEDGQLLNLLHGTLYPSNILISWDGSIKLSDFGLWEAHLYALKNRMRSDYRFLSYLSPEQIKHEKIDQRVDTYALGTLLWEILTLKPAFESNSESALEKLISAGITGAPSTLNGKINAQLDTIVLRSIAKDQDMRFTSPLTLKKELTQYLQHTTGIISDSDFYAWLQPMNYQLGSSSNDTEIESLSTGRLHGLLSSPSISTPAPEPILDDDEPDTLEVTSKSSNKDTHSEITVDKRPFALSLNDSNDADKTDTNIQFKPGSKQENSLKEISSNTNSTEFSPIQKETTDEVHTNPHFGHEFSSDDEPTRDIHSLVEKMDSVPDNSAQVDIIVEEENLPDTQNREYSQSKKRVKRSSTYQNYAQSIMDGMGPTPLPAPTGPKAPKPSPKKENNYYEEEVSLGGLSEVQPLENPPLQRHIATDIINNEAFLSLEEEKSGLGAFFWSLALIFLVLLGTLIYLLNPMDLF